jgi:hypothetical protein
METTTTHARYVHPHEAEEMEMRFGPRMWDATACCAAFQTGACAHTEASGEPDDDDYAPGELAALRAEEAAYQARLAATPVVYEPF